MRRLIIFVGYWKMEYLLKVGPGRESYDFEKTVLVCMKRDSCIAVIATRRKQTVLNSRQGDQPGPAPRP